MTIAKPEKQDIEFKQSWQDEYLKWICAFANCQGGILYIGVNDKGEVIGVDDFHHLSEAIPLKIRQTMGLFCTVNVLTDGELRYLQVIVEKYPFPVSYHGKYYKRLGSTTQELIGVELDKLILQVQGKTWDSIPVPNVQVSELDEIAFKIFRKRALITGRLTEEQLEVSNEDLLKNLRGFENDYLTRAAVLSFHPDPEKWFVGAYIKIAYFIDDADILYQDEVHGSLIAQVDEAMKIIYTKYMKALIDYEGITRRETYFFPQEAFRELLLNAVIHKDYMQTSPIQIQIFKDKIDIWNIGKMPDELKVEDLFKKHRSSPRNPKIADIFFKCGFVESWGRGYIKVQKICEESNSRLPIPELSMGGLSVVCNASKTYLDLAERYNVDSLTGTSTPQATPQVTPQVNIPEQVRKLVFVLENEMVRSELMNLLGMKDRKNFKINYLQKSLELGYIEMTQPDSPNSPTQKYRLTQRGLKFKEELIASNYVLILNK